MAGASQRLCLTERQDFVVATSRLRMAYEKALCDLREKLMSGCEQTDLRLIYSIEGYFHGDFRVIDTDPLSLKLVSRYQRASGATKAV